MSLKKENHEIRVYINEDIYTILKRDSQRLGVTMSSIVRAMIICSLAVKVLSFANYGKSYKFDD